MKTIDTLEATMRANGIVACNLHLVEGEFQVHVRRSLDEGFVCAQRKHPTLAAAIGEHFVYSPVVSVVDLSDLLV